jgi:phage terminase small subunit
VDQKETLEQREPKVHKAPKEAEDLREHRVLWEPKEQPELKEAEDPREHKGPLEC